MSTFRGTLTDTSRSHSIFTSDDPDFEGIGLPQFTPTSLQQHCKRYSTEINKTAIDAGIKSKLIAVAGTNSGDTAATSFFSDSTVVYYKFSLITKKYEETSITVERMLELVSKFEILKTRENFGDEATKTAVAEIQNSAYGYAIVQLNISRSIGQLAIPIKIRLYFKDNIDIMDGSRVMTQRDSNLMTGVPRRATGAKYSTKNTNEAENKQDNVGQYAPPSEGDGNNVENMTTGELKTVWNSTLQKWESGTQQLLAKLITDIDKANVKNVAIAVDDAADGKNFYDPEGDNYMGGFTTGLAVPLSMEDGNPHLYGPNSCTCTGGAKKIEKIRVVNRAPRSFKSGATVMCSHIDGEWIIMDFGSDPTELSPAIKIKDWSFIKLIADSDTFFKDSRYIDGTTSITDYARSILPDTYEQKSRNRFYSDLRGYVVADGEGNIENVTNASPDPDRLNLEEFDINLAIVATNNIYISITPANIAAKPGEFPISTLQYKISPSKNYFVSTIFDQLGPWMGGSSTNNFISKTNVSNFTSPKAELAATELPFFWGPVFPNGFQVNDVIRVTHATYAEPISTNTTNSYFSGNGPIVPFKTDADVFSLPHTTLFAGNDPNVKECPAEVGVIGSGNRLEDICKIIEKYELSNNFAQSMSDLLYDSTRMVNLTDGSGVDIYNMTPVAANVIQFSPLQAEFAAHADKNSQHAIRPSNFERDFYTSSRSLLKVQYASIANWWGHMFTRHKGNNIVPTYPSCSAYAQPALENPNFQNVPYDCYIKGKPTSVPIGTPQLFFDGISSNSGANLVGIIAAKSKFVRKNGGPITFALEQQFGLVGNKTTSGGQVDFTSIIGAFFSASSNALRTNSTPQWGSDNNDSYDSFGSTSMHVRIFDAWPSRLTVYDARYFAVLHFNDGKLFSKAQTKTVGDDDVTITKKFKDQYTTWDMEEIQDPNKPDDPSAKIANPNYHKVNPSAFNYSRSIDEIEYNTDFRVPTYAHPFSYGRDNEPMIDNAGVYVNSFIRPENEWRVNTICRGQMLTKGGFRYLKAQIGLSLSKVFVINGGLGFTNKQIVSLSKGASLKLNVNQTTGTVESVEWNTDGDGNALQGSGFVPSDFSRVEVDDSVERRGFFVTIPANATTGSKPAKIQFREGEVYSTLKLLTGPQERCPATRLSSSSNRGESDISSTQTTTISIDANSSGEYDAFYFFQNDITHTLMFPYAQIPGFYQYVTMTIT